MKTLKKSPRDVISIDFRPDAIRQPFIGDNRLTNMPQICTAVSDQHLATILSRAESEGKSKARIAAELISYALADNENEAARLKREIELKDTLIEQLREENSFMKSSFTTQTDIAGRLLHLLTEGVRDDTAVAGDNCREDRS